VSLLLSSILAIQTEKGRIALVGCETDKPTSSGTATEITSLAQLVAKRLYDTLMPLNQNDRSPIRILVLYEKHEKYQEYEQLKRDILAVKHEIQVAEESQVKLKKGLFLNAHQNPTLMPLNQNDRSRGMSQKTETVKNHSRALKNPLINLNEEIQRLEELLKRKKFTSKKQSKHSDLAYCCHFRSVSYYIDTVFAIDIKVDFVAV
jgi:hypothetical protein